MKLQLTDEQVAVRTKMLGMVEAIEAYLGEEVDPQNPEECAYRLERGIRLLSTTGLILQYATAIYDYCKGQAVLAILEHDQLAKAGYNLQKEAMSGMLAQYNALYERSVRCCKDLNNAIEGTRTLISYNKEVMRNISSSQG